MTIVAAEELSSVGLQRDTIGVGTWGGDWGYSRDNWLRVSLYLGGFFGFFLGEEYIKVGCTCLGVTEWLYDLAATLRGGVRCRLNVWNGYRLL